MLRVWCATIGLLVNILSAVTVRADDELKAIVVSPHELGRHRFRSAETR